VTPTLYAAVLSSPTGHGGRALTIGQQQHRLAPLVFALFTNRQAAERRLVEVARGQWDEDLAYGLGRSEEWTDARLLARMREAGYLVTVTEQAVEL
jgi:hypothetical protein